MHLFRETLTRQSEKNGTIMAFKRDGVWRVTVDGCQQTGPEVHRMWRHALSVLSGYLGVQRVKKVLLLGLGAGGELKQYYRRFPNADITVVEYDPAMIALAKELKLYHPYRFPQVICEDVRTALPKLQGTFDLIVADIFRGEHPSPLLQDESFLKELDAKLAHDGYMLANVYRKPDLLEAMSAVFNPLKRWRFDESSLALFQGSALSRAVEEGYRPVREWKEYDGIAGIPPFFHPSTVGEDQRGNYWRFGPFSFEHYKGDHEPRLEPLSPALRTPLRIIMWQRMKRSDVPAGWKAFSHRPSWKIGFVPVSASYASAWSESARRALKGWKSLESGYAIEEVGWDEFEKALKRSTLPYTMRGSACFEIRMRMQNPRTKVVLVAVRRRADNRIIAGMARMYSTEAPLSYYMNGFYLKEAADIPVMVGLFAHFFDEALSRGVRFLDLGNFWKAGDDGGWKGFSVFKGKFNPCYFFFPPTLYRFGFFEK